jgi:probable rRNA maturation factor
MKIFTAPQYKSPKITLYNSQRDLPLSIRKVRKAISFLLRELKIFTDEIIFHFVSKKKIAFLHKEFFNDPSPTDCITFPIDSPKEHKESFHLLGEAFICPKTAIEYSKRHRIDPIKELHRYIVHCILHLIGYDDIQADQRARMKRKEESYLKKLYNAGFLQTSTPSKPRQRKP